MKEFPVIGVTVSFAAGIIIQSFFSIPIFYGFVLLALLLSAALLFFLLERRKSSFGFTSILILSLTVMAGYTSARLQRNDINVIPDSIYVVKDFSAYGRIKKIDLPSKDGFSFLLQTDSIKAVYKVNARVNLLCKVWDDSTANLLAGLAPGNLIKITGIYRKGRESRNPGEFDYNKYLHSKNISGILTVYEKNDVSVISGESNTLHSMIFSARKLIDNLISTMHTPRTAALLKGLILADRNDISFETRNQFVNSGVVHVLAVSGLHAGFIALIFFILLGRLNLYLRSIITIAGLVLFLMLTGVPASVFRAVVMAVVLITAFLLNRTTNIYNSLAIAALVLLAIDPSEIFNPGFQLSFISVLSIAYFYPRFEQLIKRTGLKNTFLKYILLLAAVSLSVQIGTLPITLTYFGKFSIIALLVNLAVIPLVGIIIGTAITSLMFSSISIWTASVYAAANNMFSDLLLILVKYAGSFRYSSLEVIDYSKTDVLIFYSFIIAAIFLVRYLRSSRAVVIFVILITANIYIYSTTTENEIPGGNNLSVFMLDVGQGDAFILRFPDGKNALIDAGSASQYFDNGEMIILPAMRRLGIEKFDYGFVSHIDVDHYGGFVSLIEKGKIGKLFKPFLDSTFDKDLRFERYLNSKNIPIEYYSKKKIRIGNAEVFILNDAVKYLTAGNSLNNTSGIIKVDYGTTSFLFTGDIDKRGEDYYRMRYGSFLNADIMKVSHHGSRTGSSYEFIKSVSPGISLISCGVKNRFGHPSKEVTCRIEEAGSEIYRTDMEGCILLKSDGMQISRIDWKNYY